MMHGGCGCENARLRETVRKVSRLVCAHTGYIQPRVVIFRGESERERENAESFDRPKQIHGLKYFDVESSRSMDVNVLEQAELLAASRYFEIGHSFYFSIRILVHIQYFSKSARTSRLILFTNS